MTTVPSVGSAAREPVPRADGQVESASPHPAKSDLVRRTVLAQVEEFTLADLSAQLPIASSQLIKKVLAELKKAGKVRLAGKGRGARWLVRG